MSRGLGKVERQILDILTRASGVSVEIGVLTTAIAGIIDIERYATLMRTPISNLTDDEDSYLDQRVGEGRKTRQVRKSVRALERAGLIRSRSFDSTHKSWGGAVRTKAISLAPTKRNVQDERASYDSEVSSPDLPDVSRAHPGFDAHTYLTKSELLTRGWTDPMVWTFLRNKPDIRLGGYEEAENMLYARERVVAVEASQAFQKRQRQLEQRRARRRKRT